MARSKFMSIMVRASIGIFAAFAVSSAAVAADKVVYRSNGGGAYDSSLPGVAELQAKAFDGIVIGVHAGGRKASTHDVNNPAATPKDWNAKSAGISVGKRKQLDNGVVVGVEADVTFGGGSKSWGGQHQYDPYYGKDKINGAATVRGVLGYTPDNKTLVYGTAGLALAHTSHSLGCDRARVVATNGCRTQFEASSSQIVPGFVVGAGIEHKLTDKVSIYGEYRYSKYRTSKVTLVDPNYPAAISTRHFKTDDHAVFVGLRAQF